MHRAKVSIPEVKTPRMYACSYTRTHTGVHNSTLAYAPMRSRAGALVCFFQMCCVVRYAHSAVANGQREKGHSLP